MAVRFVRFVALKLLVYCTLANVAGRDLECGGLRWPVFSLIPLKHRHRLFVPSVANLKTARTLALDDELAVRRAQFDLANVTPSGIDFFSDQGRALQAAARSARRNVSASVDADGRRLGIEIGLKHSKE